MRLPSTILAITLLAAGCGSGDPEPGPTTAPTSPNASAPATAPASPTPTPATTAPLQALALEPVVAGLVEPVGIMAEAGLFFVVERQGRVRVFDADGAESDEAFLDIRDRVHSNSIEQGLLGLAFHPDYSSNGRFFLYHSLPDNNNQLVEYRAAPTWPPQADVSSGRVMRVFDKEPDKVRHNAGHLAFGPDGHLWVSVGDAARASVNGQDPTTPFGAIHRYDVDTDTETWAAPTDNPFLDGGGDAAIWAYGLRNPWRFSIDEATNSIWIADVGQESWEEVNTVPLSAAGTNFGWPVREGADVFYGGDPGGPTTTLTEPIHVVEHGIENGGCSITGGFVYRGAAIPELVGQYFFADWCLGWIRSLDVDDPTDVTDWSDDLGVEMPSSFGVDADGELLVVDYAAGTVSRVIAVR